VKRGKGRVGSWKSQFANIVHSRAHHPPSQPTIAAHPGTDCPDAALLLCSNRGNRCFNIARPLALEFGLHCMIRQPSADTHEI
jgi:hypothetical protein